MSVREIRNLPPSIKSLFFSRVSGARNWLDFDKDLIQDVELKNIFRLNHSNVVKVEYLSSIRRSRENPSLKQLVYLPLTRSVLRAAAASGSEPLLIRLRTVVLPRFGVGTDDGMRMQTYTENFLMSLPGTQTTPTPAPRGRPTPPPSPAAPVPRGRRSARRRNIMERRGRITNYIQRQMDLLSFDEPSEITTKREGRF